MPFSDFQILFHRLSVKSEVGRPWTLGGGFWSNHGQTIGVFAQANKAVTCWVKEGSIFILNRVTRGC